MRPRCRGASPLCPLFAASAHAPIMVFFLLLQDGGSLGFAEFFARRVAVMGSVLSMKLNRSGLVS